MLRTAVLALSLLAAPETPATADPAATPPVVVIHVYPDDGGAAATAAKTLDVLSKRAAAEGWKVTSEPRVAELLDRSPEDLVRAADALAAARAAYADALEQNSRLRLDQAQEALLRAKGAFVEASAAPMLAELRNVHLYLGIVSQNLGQPEAAAASFRTVVFLAPQLTLKTDVFPPSVVESFAEARRGVPTGAKGGLKIEADARGAVVILDGVAKGSAPRVLNDLPEGTHYLEIRAPGMSPHLQPIEVVAGIETPVVVSLKPAAVTLRQLWFDERGELGAAAIARILQARRLILSSARTTVAGVSPFAVRGAAFDASPARKAQSAEAATTRDAPTTDERLSKLADTLFKVPRATQGSTVASVAARRARILERDSALVTFETGGAYQSMMFDGHGRYVSATNYTQDNAGSPDHGFDYYYETRTRLNLQYGLREKVTVVMTVPFFTKELHYAYDDDFDGTIDSDEEDVKRDDVGIGDIVAGADVRIPRFERGALSLVYVSGRVKLPTGASTTEGFLRQHRQLIMGSGQFDLYAGIGAVLPSGTWRLGGEVGYLARLPDRVWYHNIGRARRHLNPGDEEQMRLNVAKHMGRWLAPELFLDFTHRHATQDFVDPITHQFGEAREMFLVNMGLAFRAEFSEKTTAGLVLQHPVWGKTTTTFFPLDVTGPRVALYYGVRY